MAEWKRLLRSPKLRTASLALAIGAAAALAWWQLQAGATPPALPPLPAAVVPGSDSASASVVPPPAPPIRENAHITFTTNPAANATVTWGKTRLGVIGLRVPLVVVRPRDSGPLDVLVKATGYLPVQTRAHTFGDSRVIVKLTTPEEISTLLGYRAPIDAGIPPSADGSVPPVGPPPLDPLAPPPFP